MTERAVITVALLGFVLIVAAGWTLAVVLKDSDDEIQTDFDVLKANEMAKARKKGGRRI